MLKVDRQKIIREIIKNNKVSKHSQLVKLLADKGYHFTQATISRDMHDMNIVKIADPTDGYIYVLPDKSSGELENKAAQIIADTVKEVVYQDFLVIIKTMPGYAQALASLLDQMKFPEVQGVLGGDDTIFVATTSALDAVTLSRKINNLGHKNA